MEKLSSSAKDQLRQELEPKIDSKLPIWVFCLALGLLIPATGAILAYLASQNNNAKDALSRLECRLSVLETKIDSSQA